MTKRFVGDETGIALPLAIFVMVLVGVMGAGLLVFVRNDLESVVEVNQGQRAFEIADAGAELARRQLWFDNIPEHYDVDGAAVAPYDTTCDAPGTDPDDGAPRLPASENWAPEAGVTKSFAEGKFTVTILYLNPSAAPMLCRTPELPSGQEAYFRVVSTGIYGDAKRKVEVVYKTQRTGAPEAFFAKDSITVGGSASITDVSLFSTGTVTVSNNAKICGVDRAYGRWAPSSYNSVARTTDAAGIGTTQTLNPPSNPGTCPAGNPSPVSVNENVKDFDSGTSPIFTLNPSTGQMTFPFKPALDSLNTDDLCDVAREQDSLDGAHYQTPSGMGNYPLSNWPANSSANTIVCIDFPTTGGSSRTVSWDVDGNPGVPNLPSPRERCEQPTKKGILVVRNGNFSTSQNKALFEGVIAVRGGQVTDGDYTDTGGSTCLEGFANTSDDIAINGNVSPQSTIDVINTPGFHQVTRWSWRELYE